MMIWYPNLVFVSGETIGFAHVDRTSLNASAWNGSYAIVSIKMGMTGSPKEKQGTYDHRSTIHPSKTSSSWKGPVK